MKRVTIFRDRRGVLVIQEERQPKQPSGNGDQRRKQLRNGWKPDWIKTGRPREFDTLDVAGDSTDYAGVEIMLELGMLPEVPEIAQANGIAAWVDVMQLECTEEKKAESQAILNRYFCLSSGLVSPLAQLEDDTAPKLSTTVSSAIDVLGHTCVDQPGQTCANPNCDHSPVTP